MKLYTSSEQTDKLIELGFEKPSMKNILATEGIINEEWYSIGELIEMLPKNAKSKHFEKCPPFYLAIAYLQSEQWYVDYENCDSALIAFAEDELIDALYKMLVKLKEEGVI